MSRLVQEKFQVRPPQNRNDEEAGWITGKEARAKKNSPGREGAAGGDQMSKLTGKTANFNSTPPGMDIEDQEMCDIRQMPISMGGTTDVSHDYNQGAVDKGFTRKKMLGTDDEYTNEHTDLFYGEATVDGEVGFVERGNLLDRL